MKIVIHTTAPNALLTDIKKKANDKTLKTWEVTKSTKESEFLRHATTTEQWENVLLQPDVDVKQGTLTFTSTTWSSTKITDDQTGYVIGRFVEPLMVHFRSQFSKIEVVK